MGTNTEHIKSTNNKTTKRKKYTTGFFLHEHCTLVCPTGFRWSPSPPPHCALERNMLSKSPLSFWPASVSCTMRYNCCSLWSVCLFLSLSHTRTLTCAQRRALAFSALPRLCSRYASVFSWPLAFKKICSSCSASSMAPAILIFPLTMPRGPYCSIEEKKGGLVSAITFIYKRTRQVREAKRDRREREREKERRDCSQSSG